MDETRTAPHSAATRPQEALPDDAFELVGAGWREHRPALRRPGWRQRLARLPLLPLTAEQKGALEVKLKAFGLLNDAEKSH